MKKKLRTDSSSALPGEILDLAKLPLELERPPRPRRSCIVCSSPYTPMSGPQASDDLCWVCRRLKISAWRDGDQQMTAQE